MKRLLALLAALALPGMAAANPGDDPSWSRPHAPYNVIENIYNVGTEGIAVYLISTPEGLILLDSGPENTESIVEANIKSLGFKLKDIKYLIETHAHYDHVGSMAALKRDTGATLNSTAGDVWAFENGVRDGDNRFGPGPFPPVKVDRTIADGEPLSLGGTTLIPMLTPGHTRGDTSWTMTVRHKGQDLSVLFFGSATVAGNVLVHNEVYPGIAADYEATFERLSKVHPDVFLANHQVFANLEAKYEAKKAGNDEAFIDREGFALLLSQLKADFEAALKKAQAAQP